MTELASLYQQDFSAWVQKTAELLKAERFEELDIGHLLEELSDMGTSQKEELESRLIILMAHLLKWQYQYQRLSERWREFDGRSWRVTIIEQRKRILRRLRKSPGLKTYLAEAIAETYPDAVDLASAESGLAADSFPETCPYSQAELLDVDYYPPV